MHALISGQAGVALLGEGDSAWSVTVESPESLIPRSRGDVLHLFNGARDVIPLANVTREQTVAEMTQAWRRDRARQLMLILIDHEDDSETRVLAAQCVERHFAYETIEDFVANRLCAAPLPVAADLLGAKRFARQAESQRVLRLLEGIETHQPQIAASRRSWDSLAGDLFADPADRSHFERTAIDAGAFRSLAQAAASGNLGAGIIACLQNQRLTVFGVEGRSE